MKTYATKLSHVRRRKSLKTQNMRFLQLRSVPFNYSTIQLELSYWSVFPPESSKKSKFNGFHNQILQESVETRFL